MVRPKAWGNIRRVPVAVEWIPDVISFWKRISTKSTPLKRLRGMREGLLPLGKEMLPCLLETQSFFEVLCPLAVS